MVGNIPQLGIELPEVEQVAFVVEDMDDALERYVNVLGVKPWTVYRFESPDLTDTTYRGEEVEYGMRLAIAYTGDTMLELIQPTVGPSIYKDHLEEHGEGLHHLGYFEWDEEETLEIVEKFEEAGAPVIQTGNFLGTEYWYFDTRELLNGLIFETAVRRNVEERPSETYPPEASQ